MTDQPAAPFDVERWRKRVTSGEPSWDALCVGMLAACDRISYLENATRVPTVECMNCCAANERAEGWKDSLMRQSVAREKAEASCAALVEALDTYAQFSNKGEATIVSGFLAQRAIAEHGQHGAKILSQCDAAIKNAAFDRKRADALEAERDRLRVENEDYAARNDTLTKALGSLLNKVNAVTALFRHTGKVSDAALATLCDRQIDVETALRACEEAK